MLLSSSGNKNYIELILPFAARHRDYQDIESLMAGVKSMVAGLLPYAAMVTVESISVGISTLSKAAVDKGTSCFVFTVYSNALAALILLPYSIFVNR